MHTISCILKHNNQLLQYTWMQINSDDYRVTSESESTVEASYPEPEPETDT